MAGATGGDMAVLSWGDGRGPKTTRDLADLVEKAGRLENGVHSFWQVYEAATSRSYELGEEALGLLTAALDGVGTWRTPEECCREVVRRLRAIPD